MQLIFGVAETPGCRICPQVQFWAPKAGGGGVTLVMAFLNGNAVPDLLTPRTLAAKFAGVLCGCASGLAVGPEGPMVQLGACVASIVSTGQAGVRLIVSASPPSTIVSPPSDASYHAVMTASTTQTRASLPEAIVTHANALHLTWSSSWTPSASLA